MVVLALLMDHHILVLAQLVSVEQTVKLPHVHLDHVKIVALAQLTDPVILVHVQMVTREQIVK